MLVPASRSISRSSSIKGSPRWAASWAPRVDLPAPRKPIRAIRRSRPGESFKPKVLPSSVCTCSSWLSSSPPSMPCTRASAGRVASCSSSRMAMFSARATACSELIDTLPLPLSTSARKRSLRPESVANCLRVMPRRARQARTRTPSSPSVALLSVSDTVCITTRSRSYCTKKACTKDELQYTS